MLMTTPGPAQLSETAFPLVVTVRHKAAVAQDIVLFELAHAEGAELPAFSAGAHISVRTPNGLARRYSLCNNPSERHRYVIAVKREAQGAGGSVSMVDQLKVGDAVPVSLPENYFPLAQNASRHLLIAGGIGITPILSMVHDLHLRDADFRVVYCSRAPETTAFLDELASPELAGRVQVHHDHGDPTRALNLKALLAERNDGQHLYCCGPRTLMQAVREASAHWPSGSVHFEDFGTSAHADVLGEKPFSVRLERSAIDLTIAPGVTILEAIREAGLSAPSSCESGTCGACRTRLLAGVAEHRDYVLDDDEQECEIMICVSRAKSEQLVLDL